MRPIASDQNSLRNPLNELLGKEAHVLLPGSDLPNLEADKVTLLFGYLPFPDKHTRGMYAALGNHEEKDQRMLELSSRLAEAIEHDTSLVRRAKGTRPTHVKRKTMD